MLAACESPESSPGPSKEQAVSQLQTATENLKTAIKNEVEAQIAWAKTPGTKTGMLRLLRRIVLLALTPKEQAKKTWDEAKKVVTKREGEVNAAIATLRGAGGTEEAREAKESIEKVMALVIKVRNLTDPEEVRQAGGDAIKAAEAAVSAVSDLLASGGLVYGVGSLDDYDNIKWYVITESGNTQTFPLDKILKVLGARVMSVPGLKDYWLSPKGGEVLLLRKSDGKTIPAENSNFPGKNSFSSAIYRKNHVYYQISFWVADTTGYYDEYKKEKGFYKSEIYRFKVSAPTAQLLYAGKSFSAEFAVDNDGNMVLAPYESGKGFQFFKAKADGTIDKDNPIPLTRNGQAVTTYGGNSSYSLINGPKGEIYVLQTNQGKVQLYTLGKQAQGEKFIPIKPIPKDKGGKVDIGSGNYLNYSSPKKTDTAIFFEVNERTSSGYYELKGLLRLSNGAFSLVKLPPNKKMVDVDDVSYTETSKYLYTVLEDTAGGKGGLYRVGDTDGFSPAPLRDGNGDVVNVGNVYAVGYKTGFKGEVAFAAEDKGSHWIIERKPDGTGRRTQAKGKVAHLFYLSY